MSTRTATTVSLLQTHDSLFLGADCSALQLLSVMSTGGYSDKEWAEWNGQGRSWSDEQWEWRRSQAASHERAPAEVVQAAPDPGAGPDLPEHWKVELRPDPADRNAPHKKVDFSKIQRLCNRQLKRMYGEWQAEIQRLKEEHSDALETAINSQSKTNTLLVCEKKERLEADAKYNRLVSEHEALRSQLAAEHEAQKKKMIMEYESKLLVMKNQHAEGLQIQERRAEESLDQVNRELEKSKHKQDLLAEAHQKDIRDMKSRYRAKLRQSEDEHRAYKTKVMAAVTGWHKKVNRLEKQLVAARLELELAKDPET